ncbi:MAG: DoxX family membrane protein [Bacteroidales bacterium]|mgnify:CR=1 FL=1|nr:DoxX family membrane protein [Bacteroidales bacterium]
MIEKIKTLSILVTRGLLGGIYLFFGLNWFLNFIALTPKSDKAEAFINGLLAASYFLPMLHFLEIFLGVLLVMGFFTPLVLVVLMPITINIVLYNLILNPGNLYLSLVLIVLHLYLLIMYRKSFRSLFVVH